MTNQPNLGGLNLSNISGSVQTGNIDATITAGGDVVGRDKIINHITQIKARALTAAEEAEKAQQIARQRLAQAVTAYVERIGEIAADDQDALQGGPYRGLKAYTLREAEIFFGRDEAMSSLLAHLQRGRLTILHAESGAGKSSLLQAGIQYQLIVQGHVPLYLRPYDKPPAQAIKQALLPGIDSLPELAGASLRAFLHQVTAVLGSQTILVILLDQFEELFFNLTEEARQAFVSELAACLEDEALTVRWVLALRTEFFGNLAHFRPRIKNPFENDFRLNRLPAEQARKVIEEPARRVNISYEPELIDTLLADLRDPDSGEVAPAQLQLVCLALYNLLPEAQKAPDTPATLTLAMYDKEKRAEGILRGYLQRVLRNELNPQDRELARQLLIALVSSDQRRIRRTQSELAATLSTYLTAARSLDGVLNQLVDSRLLNVEEDEQSGEYAYELAHDLLLRQIEIDPETQARKAAEELLKQEVEAFKRHGTLLSQDKFDIINSQREFLTLDDDAAELLRLSQEAIEAEEREKERQRRQRTQIVFGFGIVATILAIVAGIFFFRAQTETENAKSAQQKAERQVARLLAVLSNNFFDNEINHEVPYLLAIESGRAALEAGGDLPDADQALRRIFQQPIWVQQTFQHDEGIRQVFWNSDNSKILTLDDAGTIRVWDVAGGSELLKIDERTVATYRLRWSADGNRILTLGFDDTVRILDAKDGSLLSEFDSKPENFFVEDISWNVDDSQILVKISDGFEMVIQVWDVGTKALWIELNHDSFLEEVQWSSDGAFLLAHDGIDAYLWNADTGHKLDSPWGTGLSVMDIDWSHATSHQVLITTLTEAQVWDIKREEMLYKMPYEGVGLMAGIWSYDDSMIAIIDNAGTLNFWEAGTKPTHLNRLRQKAQVDYARWSKNGKRFVTGVDNSVYVWDVKSGRQIGHLQAEGFTEQVQWNNEGTHILAAHGDGWARIWSIAERNEHLNLEELGELIDVACATMPRNHLTRAEWDRYMPSDEPYRPTCSGLPVEAE